MKTALRWVLGLVLVWAALGKLANVQEFYVALLAYRLPVPPAMLQAAAIVLPWLELLCGLLLLARLRATAALAWAAILFAIFAVATGQAWLRGLPIACGCLDLRLLGIAPESALGHWLESPGFAFGRALVLLGFSAVLWRAAFRAEDQRSEKESAQGNALG
jgi:uncharacterized membrane protein YphA (DoxX/SURF4 family)